MTTSVVEWRWWHVAYDTVNLSVAPIYLILTVTALASLVVPDLNHLASHGKTRITKTTTQTNLPPRPTWFSRIRLYRCYQLLLHDSAWLVEKRFFCHFYFVGFFWALALLWIFGGSDFEPWDAQSVAQILLLLHLVRRWYECIVVHKWKPTSKMHLAGYLLGLIHYALLPLVFISTLHDKSSQRRLMVADNGLFIKMSILICLMVGIWAQYEQHVHHIILSRLRRTTHQQGHSLYGIPDGRWFQLISCPHYFAEIIIYVAWAVLLQLPSSTSSTSSGSSFQFSRLASPDDTMFWLLLRNLKLYRPWILCIWVTTNLAVSAKKNHIWYLQHFPNYASLQRKILIPWIW